MGSQSNMDSEQCNLGLGCIGEPENGGSFAV